MENRFNFYVPVESDELEKAVGKTTETGRYDNMVLEGVASDNSEDSDGEFLEPDGFVLDRFLRDGLVNYEHLAKTGGPSYIIGEPVSATVDGGKLKVKAKLYKGRKVAEDLWDTLLTMRENGSSRKLGWSIEGKTLEKDPNNPKRIRKALITHIALTFMPKNYNTYADIVKGEVAVIEPENGVQGGVLIELDVEGKTLTVFSDLSIKIKDKSMGVAEIAPLVKESLEKKVLSLAEVKTISDGYKSGIVGTESIAKFLNNRLKS